MKLGGIQEEFGFYPDNEHDSRILAISDGTLLRVNYDADGIWRLTKIATGTAEFSKAEGDVESDTPDIVILSGDQVKWVAFASVYAM